LAVFDPFLAIFDEKMAQKRMQAELAFVPETARNRRNWTNRHRKWT
jgi:hypothetical protein